MINRMFLALILSLMFVASPVFAQSVNTGLNPCANLAEATKNLTSNEVSTLLESCRIKNGAISPEEANKWGEVAKGVAQALGIAAKELGVATNDFMKSPAGFLLTLILLVKFCGGFLIGVPMTVFFVLTWWFINRRIMQDSITYTYTPVFWGLFSVKRVLTVTTEKNEYTGVFAILTGIVVTIVLIIIWVNI